MYRWSSVDRAQSKASRDGDGERGGPRFVATRASLHSRRAANDNRLSLKGWIARSAALALPIGMAVLLAWVIAG